MFIRWQHYQSVARWHWRHPPITRCKSILVESVRVNGDPRLQHIAFIASYEEGELDQLSARVSFWRRARQRLDQLGNRIAEDRDKIEAALARRVPPTTPEQEQACDREFAESWRQLRELLAACRF